MKSLYKHLNRTIGPYVCVTIGKTDKEDVISGPRGEIRHMGGDRYQAIQVDRYNLEKIIYFKFKDLHKRYLAIGGPISASDQVGYANNPNKRLGL